MLTRDHGTGQSAPPPCQCRKTLTEGGMQSLDRGGGDDSVALRATPERLHTRGGAIDDAACDVDRAPRRLALHDLCHAAMAPGTASGDAPALPPAPAHGTSPAWHE